jgi:phage gpG-like protein
MKVSIKVTKKDLGWKRVKRSVQDASKAHALVGWLGGGRNAELAAIHEFGAPERGIPARAPVATMMRTKENELRQLTERLIGEVATGAMSTNQALGLLGAKAASELKKTIATGPHLTPALKPATIARKGSDRPLVDTGRLVNSISWVVVGTKEPTKEKAPRATKARAQKYGPKLPPGFSRKAKGVPRGPAKPQQFGPKLPRGFSRKAGGIVSGPKLPRGLSRKARGVPRGPRRQK